MDQAPQQAQPTTPQAPITSPQVELKHERKVWKILGIVFGGIAIIFALLAWFGFYLGKQSKNLSIDSRPDSQQNNTETTISLLGNTYKSGPALPESTGADFTSESYEWVKGMETVENWKTLITTHKLTPLSIDKPLSAEVYAYNVATLQTDNGATFIETSIINTADAAKEGVDISNPPYLLIYAFYPANESAPMEFYFQKIENADEGKVSSFIYAEKIQISSEDELEAFLSSPPFFEKRSAVVLEKFPY